MIKKTVILLAVSLLSINVGAQNISSSKAFDIAQEFMSKKGVKLSQRSNTRGESDCSIFTGEDGKGFAIVKDGIVVCYSTDGTTPECLVMANTRTFELTPKTPIEPLIKCQWNQSYPYNINMPMHHDGWEMHYLTGCVTAALAQVVYYYKNPGCDALPAYSAGLEEIDALPATTFDWNLILPYYEHIDPDKDDGIYTKEEEEVAKLFQYIASAIKVEYYSNNMAGSCGLIEDFVKPLGFSEEKSYSTVGKMLSDEELEEIFDRELEQGRPVMMCGMNKDYQGGHCIVVDGRDDTGRYHVAEGKQSGYYIMSKEMLLSGEEGVYYYMTNVVCIVPIMPDGWVIPTYSTDIKTPTTRNDDSVYNLQGQKVGNTLDNIPSGVYIKGGKKYIVK